MSKREDKKSIYDFDAVTIEGSNFSLRYFKKRYLLILNIDK